MQVFRNITVATSFMWLVAGSYAQQTTSDAGAAINSRAPLAATVPTSVPALVPFSARASDSKGKPLAGEASVTFQIYKDQQGGEALFTESQMVTFDEAGHYKVQLGAANPNGLPPDLFSSGEARWLEVQVAGQLAEPRVLIASVPYALKAADAATLGGLPASAFALAGSNSIAAVASAGITPDTATTVTTTGGGGNRIAKFSGTSTIVNSILYDNGTEVGIGTTSPTATLTVDGTMTINGATAFNGSASLIPTGTATSSTGYDSELLKIQSSAYNSSSKAAVQPRFEIQAEPINNNTASPGGTLNLLSSTTSASVAETGFYFKTDGTMHFAPGQTFPGGTGTGTITGVTAGTGLSGGGTSGTVSLKVNTSVVPELTTNNTFTGSNVFKASLYEDTDVNIDNNNTNPGNSISPGLRFGSASGEGISSQRTTGAGNQYGLDFYTDYAERMSISESGGVGIGVLPDGYEQFIVTDATGYYAGLFDNNSGFATVDIYNATTQYTATVLETDGSGSDGNGASCLIDTDADIQCDGTISGSGTNFKIDHPLDPANKYLVHASVESSEMMNMYSGNVTTDELGVATVTLPQWFEVENGDFRYQLTTIGRDAHAWVSQEVANGVFKIATNATNVKVSWQITAVRQDGYAKAHPLVVEEAKTAKDRGLYQHPGFFGQPKEKGMSYAHRPSTMRAGKAQPAKRQPLIGATSKPTNAAGETSLAASALSTPRRTP